MPPRVKLPHGLTKDPKLMSWGEKGVFALLAASIGLGVYDLATSPWGEQPDSSSTDKNHMGSSSSSFGHERIKRMGGMQSSEKPTVLELTEDLKPKRTTLAVEDGITQVDATLQPPTVSDGVTDIKFGDPQRR